jgi:hypothetical protein
MVRLTARPAGKEFPMSIQPKQMVRWSAAAVALRLALLVVAPIATATPVLSAAPQQTPAVAAQQRASETGGGPVDPGLPSPFAAGSSSAFGELNGNALGEQTCERPSEPTLRTMKWAYYPGYGCGPVPPPRTIYP